MKSYRSAQIDPGLTTMLQMTGVYKIESLAKLEAKFAGIEAPATEIKAAGRWNSDAWEGYIEQCVQLCEGKSDKLLAPFLFVKCN